MKLAVRPNALILIALLGATVAALAMAAGASAYDSERTRGNWTGFFNTNILFP